MLIRKCDNADEVRPLAEKWLNTVDLNKYGIEADVDTIVADLESWMAGDGLVLVAYDEDEIVGAIAVFVVDSYLGRQKFAVEKYWYCDAICPMVGVRLWKAAVEWCTEQGCSHILASSSYTTDRHGSTEKFLEGMGAMRFERMYVMGLN